MNVDFKRVETFGRSIENLLDDEFHDPQSLPNQIKRRILFRYLQIFIEASTTNDFVMRELPNNNHFFKTTTVLDLYKIAYPDWGYVARMAILRFIMARLPYDISLNAFPDYERTVGRLLGGRQPVTEEGDFGSFQKFMQQEGAFWIVSEKRTSAGVQYEIDLRRYQSYEVRPGFAKYGVHALLDEQFNVMSVDGVDASDASFPKKLQQLKSTLCLDIILFNHAILSHLVVSQQLYMDITTTHYDSVAHDDLLEQFFYLITYRTNEINSNIPVLAGEEGSLIQMGFGFTPSAFLKLMADLYNLDKINTTEKLKAYLLNQRSKAWHKVASGVFKVVSDHVDRIMQGKSLPAELVERTKVALFVSTFFHETMGDYQLKTIYNCDLNTRTYEPDPFERRTEEFAHIISAATMGVSVRILKLHELVADNSGFIRGHHKALWKQFYNELGAALRDVPWANVENFEFSVGY